MINKITLLFVILGVSSCNIPPKDNDGNPFGSIKVGTSEWMSENLNVRSFRNGELIPEAKSAGDWELYGKEHKPAWCFLNDPANGKTYGRLYNWYAIADPRGLSPDGWHVPSDEEWKQLTDFFGGEIEAAMRIRSTGLPEKGKNGFDGLPAGSCNSRGFQGGYGSFACWWTSTGGTESKAWMRLMSYEQGLISSLVYDKACGLSVRCIRDIK